MSGEILNTAIVWTHGFSDRFWMTICLDLIYLWCLIFRSHINVCFLDKFWHFHLKNSEENMIYDSWVYTVVVEELSFPKFLYFPTFTYKWSSCVWNPTNSKSIFTNGRFAKQSRYCTNAFHNHLLPEHYVSVRRICVHFEQN